MTLITIDDLDIVEVCLFKKAQKIGTRLASKGNNSCRLDIRYTTYNTLASIFRTAKLLLIYKQDNLDENDWWDQNFDRYFDSMNYFLPVDYNSRMEIKQTYYKQIPKDFYDFSVVGLYSSLFSMIESRFRVFYNYYFKTSKIGEIEALLNFGKLSCNLINKLQLHQKENAIKLFTIVRNTIHNNGVYTREDTVISYKGLTYKFINGKATGYGDPLRLLVQDIFPDVMTILYKIIDDLDGYNTIVDPFAI